MYLKRLKQIKEEKRLTLNEIAQLSNIPLPTVTRIFNGQTPNPTFETFSHIAIALGASLDEIAGLKEPDAPPILSPIEKTLNNYSELLKEKDAHIEDLRKEKNALAKEKKTLAIILTFTVGLLIGFLLFDVFNGHLGFFRY